MIGFLSGKIARIMPDYCLLDVNGVGYRVHVAKPERLHQGEAAEFFTHLAVSENSLTLYGFPNVDEYGFFQKLTAVSGIGPKSALALLAAAPVDAICRAILGKDVKFLTKLPGVGKKTAERMIVELKDKVTSDDVPAAADFAPDVPEIADGDKKGEAAAALLALGYTNAETAKAMRQIKDSDAGTTEEIIKKALKILAGAK